MSEDGFDALLLKGIAQVLADEVDDVTWLPDGSAYELSATGVFLIRMPATPDRAVLLTLYGFGDDPTLSNSSKNLQIRTRGAGDDSTDALNLNTACGRVLLGRYPRTVGDSIEIQKIRRTSQGPLGIDDLQRAEHTSNYELGVYEPTPHRY